MENKESTNTVLKIAVVIVVLILLYIYVWPYIVGWWHGPSSNESFVDARNSVDNTIPIDFDQLNVDIAVNPPPFYDPATQTIQSGSLFIPQPDIINTQGQLESINQEVNGTGDNGRGIGDNGLNFNLCSPACCSDQWPVPFKTPVDKMTCDSKGDFVPTDYFCNNGWQDSGCLCMKKDQAQFLNSRGHNSTGFLP